MELNDTLAGLVEESDAKNSTFSKMPMAALALFVATHLAMVPAAEAASNRGGGGAKAKPQVNNSRTDTRTNNVRSTSVNNVNVNKNVNVNVDNNRGCCNNGWDNDHHPIATAAAVTVTSAMVGSIVNAPPPGCVPVNCGGYIYQRCGSIWYQPQGAQDVVIAPPY